MSAVLAYAFISVQLVSSVLSLFSAHRLVSWLCTRLGVLDFVALGLIHTNSCTKHCTVALQNYISLSSVGDLQRIASHHVVLETKNTACFTAAHTTAVVNWHDGEPVFFALYYCGTGPGQGYPAQSQCSW